MKTYKKAKPITEKSLAKRREERKGLPEFFTYAIEELKKNPYCQETGEYIYNVSALNCAHIFPKRRYKSVALNLDNIILYSWNSHTKFDNLLDAMDFKSLEKEFPNSWPVVLSKVKLIIGQVTEHGKLVSKFENYFENNGE